MWNRSADIFLLHIGVHWRTSFPLLLHLPAENYYVPFSCQPGSQLFQKTFSGLTAHPSLARRCPLLSISSAAMILVTLGFILQWLPDFPVSLTSLHAPWGQSLCLTDFASLKFNLCGQTQRPKTYLISSLMEFWHWDWSLMRWLL